MGRGCRVSRPRVAHEVLGLRLAAVLQHSQQVDAAALRTDPAAAAAAAAAANLSAAAAALVVGADAARVPGHLARVHEGVTLCGLVEGDDLVRVRVSVRGQGQR
jgi:hypothetical protein